MPDIERREPAYVQIADHYRDAILSGELNPGDRLPSITEIADQWHVARATAANAIGRLQVERAVYTSPQGTFVSSDDHITRTPGDRIRGSRPVRVAAAEVITLNEAGIVRAPNYVAELVGIEAGSMIIRREEITSLRGKPRMLSVDWIPTGNVMAEAELLGPPTPEGPIHVIETISGRHVTHAQDHLESREADTREAAALKLPVGSPILAGVHIWSDDDGVLLYGEWVVPPRQVITYAYEVADLTAKRPARSDSTTRAGLDPPPAVIRRQIVMATLREQVEQQAKEIRELRQLLEELQHKAFVLRSLHEAWALVNDDGIPRRPERRRARHLRAVGEER
jgi:GntR family transcriptional regulator